MEQTVFERNGCSRTSCGVRYCRYNLFVVVVDDVPLKKSFEAQKVNEFNNLFNTKPFLMASTLTTDMIFMESTYHQVHN